jgi:FtsZ-binding cell division protein ZapB
MKSKLRLAKSPRSPATEAKVPKALSADERNVLTARVAALLDENNQLLRQLASTRTERDALERALNALKRNRKREQRKLHAIVTVPVALGSDTAEPGKMSPLGSKASSAESESDK